MAARQIKATKKAVPAARKTPTRTAVGKPKSVAAVGTAAAEFRIAPSWSSDGAGHEACLIPRQRWPDQNFGRQ
jgi:hypothetical protein